MCVRKKLLKQSEKNTNNPELEVQFMGICEGCDFVVQVRTGALHLKLLMLHGGVSRSLATLSITLTLTWTRMLMCETA